MKCSTLAPCAVALLVLAYPCFAQEADKPAPPAVESPDNEAPDNKALDKSQIEAALKLTTSEAEKYQVLVGDSRTPAQLKTEPLLRWSNPSTGQVHGNVFLWIDNGRPALIGSLFKWFSPHNHMSHEFHSLSEEPLAVKYGEQPVWRTAAPGLQFQAVSESPQPAGSPAQRLLQMRQIARKFAVVKKERDGSQVELRILTQPIHRYGGAGGPADGGLFAFVQGTDPELFVLLEARPVGDPSQWQYALVRMNGVGFVVRYGDREVWSVEPLPWADIYSHRQPYTSFRFDSAAP